jgi:hypothetical protein
MGGYGGLERSVKDERGLWVRMRKKEIKFWCYNGAEVGHGRATYWQGPCQVSEISWSWLSTSGMAVPTLARAVPAFWT